MALIYTRKANRKASRLHRPPGCYVANTDGERKTPAP